MKYKSLLALFLMGLLTACGGGNSNPDPDPDPIEEPEPQPEPEPEPEPETGDSNFPRGSLGDNDTVPAVVCTQTLSSASELEDAVSYDMAAGTTLCLADGNYTNLEIQFGGIGTEENPITVAAANPGQVTIGGEVSIRMSGEYVVLQGFIFKDGESASSDFLQTRGNSNTPCNHCRITEIAVIDFDQNSDSSGKWIHIYGAHNRVDHSWFSGKTTRGALLVVDRYIEDGVDPLTAEIDYAQIDHNYFGDRPPIDGKAYAESGDNEYEGIRIGTSDSHAGDSFSVVEHNYFERIQGEAEVISNKSGNNRIEHNTVRNSYGSITTRHGSSATISNNFIIGDDHPYAGGLRIIDDGHTVTNNYIQGARYLATTHHGGIVLMGSDGTNVSGYQQLTNVLVAHNTVVDSVNSLNVDGGKKSTNPNTVYLVNNIIADGIGPVITEAADGMPATSVIAGNVFYGQSFSDDDDLTSVSGITWADASLAADMQGVLRATGSSPDLTAVAADTGDFVAVTLDMDGLARASTTQAGADDDIGGTAVRGILNSYDVGPISYRPPVTTPHVAEVDIANHAFDDAATGWTVVDGSVNTNAADVFSRGASMEVMGANGRASQVVSLTANTNYTLTAFVKGAATLAADVGGTVYRADENSQSAYKLASVSFNSGDATSATIYGAVDDFVLNFANIGEASLDGFNGSDTDFWTTYEGDGIGQVQGSDNSAAGANGSVKFKLNDATEVGTPRISQVLTGLELNTDYTLSMYALYKKSADVTVTMGAFVGETTTVLASKVVDFEDLEAANAPEGDDSFRQDTLTFNTGSNSTITIYAEYNANTIVVDGGDAGDTEFRVDEFALSYEGAPASDAKAYFDDFRLVSHASLAD